eukprot:6201043-Pleurochrysis_carterae.AAC.2
MRSLAAPERRRELAQVDAADAEGAVAAHEESKEGHAAQRVREPLAGDGRVGLRRGRALAPAADGVGREAVRGEALALLIRAAVRLACETHARACLVRMLSGHRGVEGTAVQPICIRGQPACTNEQCAGRQAVEGEGTERVCEARMQEAGAQNRL